MRHASEEPARDTPAAAGDEEPLWRRRQRLARIFGDVLPEQTTDDDSAADRASGDSVNAGDSGDLAETAEDRWLRQQVPPHHGG